LDCLGIDGRIRDAVELGCGYGTFSIPVARRLLGTLYTVDVDPAMVARTRARAEAQSVTNLVCKALDVMAEGFGVPPASMDACLLFNILHCEEPVRLLRLAGDTLRDGGAAFVIHWRYDPATPRGPSMDIRPRPEQIIAWALETGLFTHDGKVIDLPPWHYGLRLARAPR
ncbi:MAG TPA: class I SAM-dependent methyltransferase, partial [Candidatus Hydrogenedentes bacterium]|nr:class I SAM-dependent methyltransferase [Candidatus Hydrogenedentota bacterium]